MKILGLLLETRPKTATSFSEKKIKTQRLLKVIFRFTILTSIAFILSMRPASAATVQFSLAHNATSNIFQSYQPISDQLTAANLSFGGDSSSVSLYGNLDLTYLYKYSGLSSIGGKVGADYLATAGARSAFYFALEGEAVYFKALYDYFNHATIRFLANFKSYLTPSTILRLDSTSQYRNYKYSIFDYFSENLTLSVDNYFSTRTTIKAEASYGYKLYFHPGVISSSEGSGTLTEASGIFLTTGMSGSQLLTPSVSMSSQAGPGGNHGNPGHNYEMGGSYSLRGIPYQTVYYEGSQNIQVLSISGLIAQGLGDHIGVSLSALKQWYLGGENPFASSDELFLVENPTYDQFSWRGYSLRAKLTAEISDRLHSEVQYDYFSREFPGITSLDLEGNSLGLTRKDRRHQIGLRIQLDLSRISFFANGAYLKNISNDPWFTWDGKVISAGLVWNLSVSSSK
ncbi:MAG: hypothetical protein ACPLRA_03715 [Candidatus Saccharicenans sp.]